MTVFEFEILTISMVVLVIVGLTILILAGLNVKGMRDSVYLVIFVLALAGMCGQSLWIGRDSSGLYTLEVTAPSVLRVTSVAEFRVPRGATEVREVATMGGVFLVDAKSGVIQGKTLYLVVRRRIWGRATRELACMTPGLAQCWPVGLPQVLSTEHRADRPVMSPGRT